MVSLFAKPLLAQGNTKKDSLHIVYSGRGLNLCTFVRTMCDRRGLREDYLSQLTF